MDRPSLRRFADRLPLKAAVFAVTLYLIKLAFSDETLGGLITTGIVIVLAWITAWVLRRVSGMTWREALWPRREPSKWETLPTSMESVRELARAGMKLPAIKMHRELTGQDISTSKRAVEAMIGKSTGRGPRQ